MRLKRIVFSSTGVDAIEGHGDGNVSNPNLFVNPNVHPFCRSTYGLLRQIGGTLGISIGGAIYASGLRARLPNIEGYTPDTGFGMTNDLRGLTDIQVRHLQL